MFVVASSMDLGRDIQSAMLDAVGQLVESMDSGLISCHYYDS